ncbi:glycosyltransferase family 2 protein, partial [Vibrio cholerae]
MAYYPKPSISVIMPVYNTEMYIERAIVSLMEQTLQNIQFIIIDDGSNDDSLEIIKSVMSRYPERQKQLTLISRENRGVAFTRAEGLAIADGEYIIHMDSDDFVAITWLESLYCKALEESADVVICDFDMYLKNKIISVREMVKKNPDDCVRYLLTGKLSNSNCN